MNRNKVETAFQTRGIIKRKELILKIEIFSLRNLINM
jgi:hypothetical protein